MEFRSLFVLALCYLTIVRIDATSPSSAENYWLSIWPSAHLPKAFSDLLLPYGRTNSLPIRGYELNQYSTFFFEHDLYPGNKITLGHPFGKSRRQGATYSIWLANKERQSLDDFCESPTALGEHKHCVSSLESMMDYVITKFGTTKIKSISSTFALDQDQYTVEEVKQIGNNAVMCHRLNFEKVVFNCHQVKKITAYIVSLVVPDGTKAKAVTVCHYDTRGMNPSLLDKVFQVKPGTVPICHFIGNKAAVWVPDSSEDHQCAI